MDSDNEGSSSSGGDSDDGDRVDGDDDNNNNHNNNNNNNNNNNDNSNDDSIDDDGDGGGGGGAGGGEDARWYVPTDEELSGMESFFRDNRKHRRCVCDTVFEGRGAAEIRTHWGGQRQCRVCPDRAVSYFTRTGRGGAHKCDLCLSLIHI